MKNKAILILLTLFFTSCNSAQETTDTIEIQKWFNIKSGVKEIQTTTKVFTTMGKQNFTTKTIFNKIGEPIETIEYDKDGKNKKTEPWIKANANETKDSELTEEYDTDKRLIKSTKYDNGIAIFQTYYKYDSTGNKIEEYDKINGKRIEYKYLNKLISEEITYNKAEDNNFYWYCKKKFNYDGKSNLIEMLVYYYPDDKAISGKYLYKYDSKGSMIETVGYVGNEISEKTNRKIVYY